MAQTWALYIRSRPIYIGILCTSTMTNGYVTSLEFFIRQNTVVVSEMQEENVFLNLLTEKWGLIVMHETRRVLCQYCL